MTRQPFMPRDYYSDPRRRFRSGVARALSRPLRRAGFDFEVRTFYSPIPPFEIPDSVWRRRSELPGIDLDVEAQLSWAEDELARHIDEFKPPTLPTGNPWEYHLDNGLFQGGDADLLYAMIRHFKPARILELGAGFSTMVSAAAVLANRSDGTETRLVSADPYAEPPPPGALPGLGELVAVAAEELAENEFGALRGDDILFIDSSHTVRTGGDVVHLICEVLPRLAPGVIVHLHDVFLPYEYPREWVEHNRWYWAEQYMLQALLAHSRRIEVLFAAHAAWRAASERMSKLIPNIDPRHAPISFWLRVAGE